MSNPRRKYDREFKIEAVRLVARGDKTQAQIARDLGVSANQLAHWRQQQAADPQFAFPGKGHLKPADEELRKLKRDLRDVTEERDILKKALAIFSKMPGQDDDS